MCLEGTSITDNNMHQTNLNTEVYVLDAFNHIKRSNYGSNGSDAGNPCPNCNPDLNYLIERHCSSSFGNAKVFPSQFIKFFCRIAFLNRLIRNMNFTS